MATLKIDVYHHIVFGDDPFLQDLRNKVNAIHRTTQRLFTMTQALTDAVSAINGATNSMAASQTAIGTAVGRVGISVQALIDLAASGATPAEVTAAVATLGNAGIVLAAAQAASLALADNLTAIAASAEQVVPPAAVPAPLPPEIPPVTL